MPLVSFSPVRPPRGMCRPTADGLRARGRWSHGITCDRIRRQWSAGCRCARLPGSTLNGCRWSLSERRYQTGLRSIAGRSALGRFSFGLAFQSKRRRSRENLSAASPSGTICSSLTVSEDGSTTRWSSHRLVVGPFATDSVHSRGGPVQPSYGRREPQQQVVIDSERAARSPDFAAGRVVMVGWRAAHPPPGGFLVRRSRKADPTVRPGHDVARICRARWLLTRQAKSVH